MCYKLKNEFINIAAYGRREYIKKILSKDSIVKWRRVLPADWRGWGKFCIDCKLKVIITSTKISDLPIEIQEMLDNYFDIIVDCLPNELPPIRNISHHIDLIPRENLPNKVLGTNKMSFSKCLTLIMDMGKSFCFKSVHSMCKCGNRWVYRE